jgi:hypothetical protein
MPRYIDADEVLETMRSNMDMQELYLPTHFIDLIIEDMPTADVQPVRHGRWIEHPDDIFPLESTIECSECGEQENVNIHNDNFCPNCGARMDGDTP